MVPKDIYIDSTAKVERCTLADNCRIYKNVLLSDCILSPKASIGDFSRISGTAIGRNVVIQRFAQIFNSHIGDYSYTGRNFTMWHAEIGKFCSISWNVSIGGANHDYRKITSHAFLYNDMFGLNSGRCGYDRFNNICKIGNDVWIAANSVICRGVSIGDGAVIAAGAVVTKDVEPYSIVAGVPAKHIKYRFDKEIVDELKKIKWWNLPYDTIKENFELFNSEPTQEILERFKHLVK